MVCLAHEFALILVRGCVVDWTDVAEQDGMEIPMGEVDARILAKVVEYCKFHHHQETNQTSADEADRWEKNFVQVDKSTLFQLILVSCRQSKRPSMLDFYILMRVHVGNPSAN